jgi:O-antigen/teichoic acid export membrane protein
MNKLLKNWSYLLLSDVTKTFINIFVFIVLARKLTPEGYGEFNVVMALVAMFSIFAQSLGSNQVVIREISTNPDSTKSLFSDLLKLRAASYMLTCAALIIFMKLNSSYHLWVIIAGVIIVLSNILWDVSESIAFGHLVTKYTTYFNVSMSLVWLIVLVTIPEDGMQYDKILLFYSSLLFFRAIIYLYTTIKVFILKSGEQLSVGIKALLLMSLPYMWMRGLSALTDQVPVLLLNTHSHAGEVGLFAVGYRLLVPITITINTGIKAIYPLMAKLYHEDRSEFNKKIAEGFNFVLVGGTLVASVLVSTSEYWIPLVFGQAYEGSILPFNLLAWYGVALSFDLLLSSVLSATYRQKLLAVITSIDVVISLPILYYGSMYGAFGLASAKLISVLLLGILHLVVIVRVMGIELNNRMFYNSTGFFVLMLGASILINQALIKMLAITLIVTYFSSISQSPTKYLWEYASSVVWPRKIKKA